MTDSENWCPATNPFDLQREAYSRCQHNSSKPFAISWLAYSYQLFSTNALLDKPHILVVASETGFLLFKEQVLLKL